LRKNIYDETRGNVYHCVVLEATRMVTPAEAVEYPPVVAVSALIVPPAAGYTFKTVPVDFM